MIQQESISAARTRTSEKPVVNARVLVVDDEPQILLALEDLLGEDYTVLKAATPQGALEVIANDSTIAVVITDQRMPHMTGDELLSKLTGSSAVGIMVSGFADLPAVIRAINQGRIFAYVTKPWNPDDLRQKVQKAVEHFRLVQQVAHERRLLSDLMDNSPDGIFFKDSKLRFQSANRSFAHLVAGVDPDKLLGKRLGEGPMPAEEAAPIEAEEQRVLESGKATRDVVRLYGAGRVGRWLSETKAPVRGHSGKVVGMVGISRDVTERLRTSEALSESEVRLRQQTRILNSILEGIGEGVVVVDSAGHTLLYNREAERILGPQAPDVPLERWTETYGMGFVEDGAPLPASESPLIRAVAEQTRVEMEVMIRRPHDAETRVAVVVTPLRDDRDRVTGAITLLRDVTEPRRMEFQLAQSQKMEAIGQLAGGVAHDFNNILAVIEGNGQLALDDLEGHPALEGVQDMMDAAKRATTLTRQLLSFSRRDVVRPAPLALNLVVANLERMLRRLLGEHIALVTRLEPTLRPIEADTSQIEQVVLNLCINARDAMPGGGTLTIETRDELLGESEGLASEQPFVRLTVSDTGAGMDAQTQKRIFEPFFTTKDVGRGTGLGLSMVYGIVSRSGGRISVQSEPGLGTSFSVVFPADLPMAGLPTTALGAPPKRTGLVHGTILLVEDDLPVRQITARILRRAGYVVLEAGSPSEALACSVQPELTLDLLLTDLRMPESSGVVLAKKVLELRPMLPVLFMSGHPGSSLTEDPLARVVPELIEKPFTGDLLLERVRSALTASRRPSNLPS